jgi:hypothetical protein
LRKIAGSLDLLLITVNVLLDWTAMIGTLRPKGRMHVVGAVLEPIDGHHHAAAEHLGFAYRLARDDANHARICGASPYLAADGAFPDD